jgi:thiol-disulfide isomerase/thioredoxin
MVRVLFGSGQCLLAFLFTMPGCFRTNEPLPPSGPRVGMTAPDIRGEDLDGTPFKLSDYRGKVVVVSFWASWCPPCRALIPHERAMVDRFKGRPFALIGVNADQEKRLALKAAIDEGVNWRSFWDGGDNAIQKAFAIEAYPTVYVIDEQGVIRYKPAFTQNMTRDIENVVEKMLLQVEARK